VEALYAALPVVTAAIGGAQEIVDDSRGRLVPAADAGALRGALAELINGSGVRPAPWEPRARACARSKPSQQQLLRMQRVFGNLGVNTGISGGPEVREASVS
jgi:glycosyltransferase involved in cell wall biosynthesis